MAKQGFVWYGKGTTLRYRTAKIRVFRVAEDDGLIVLRSHIETVRVLGQVTDAKMEP